MAFSEEQKKGFVAFYLKHKDDEGSSIRQMASILGLHEKSLSNILRKACVYKGNHAIRYTREDDLMFVDYYLKHREDPGFSLAKMARHLKTSPSKLRIVLEAEGVREPEDPRAPPKPRGSLSVLQNSVLLWRWVNH